MASYKMPIPILCLFLFVALLVQTGRACDGNEDEQPEDTREQSEWAEYLARLSGWNPNPWDSVYYYQTLDVPEYANFYEGRTHLNRQPPSINPFRNDKNTVGDDGNQVEGRFGLSNFANSIINSGLFNNRFTASGTKKNPFSGLANFLPIAANPNYASPLATFESCNAPSGEAGICSPGSICSFFGGRPSGSCLIGGVCCINAITNCGGAMTLNNTFWQSPTTAVSAPSTCALTVKLNNQYLEQKKPICQVRLDFISFSIGGTGTTPGTCTDTFQVGGAINTVPTICGDNNGQHMYLDVPSSAITSTDLQLMFNFATGTTTTRSWNIKIAILPCGASYLAPSSCLQYFTSASGTVSSFNWKDVAAQRQLNNQNYNICFRNELVNSQKANKLCLAPCSGNSFILGAGLPVSTNLANGNSGTATTGGCLNDFIVFIGGFSGSGPFFADRFCGQKLDAANPSGGSSVTSLCSTFKPFRLLYFTDASEVVTGASLTDTSADVGFCFGFTQS